MKLTALFTALLFAGSLFQAAGAAADPAPDTNAAGAAEEPAVTMPAEYVTADPLPELYGFAPETPEIALEAGETFQLRAVWDADSYLAASLQFASDNAAVAAVTADGVITAREEGTAKIRMTAKLNPEAVSIAQKDSGVRTVSAFVTVTDHAKTDEQKAQLKALKVKENRLFGEFRRARAVILGDLAADAPRITMKQITGMIAESESFDEIMQKLGAAQPYPDYFGGSGLTLIEYWFDDLGTEKILVTYEQADVIYIRLDESGNIADWHFLYPAEQPPVNAPDTGIFNRTYLAYHGALQNGDANCDDSLDVSDAVLTARFVAEDHDAVITAQGKLNADMNRDGNLTGDDVIAILRKIAKFD